MGYNFCYKKLQLHLDSRFSLVTSDEVNYYVVICPMERSTWKGTKGSLQQTEQETEALSPTICKEVNSVNNRMILELSFPS